MNNELVANGSVDWARLDTFLETPNEDSFAELFKTFTPQLVAFFRARRCGLDLAEDLAQDVMLIVYRKASQIRDRKLFRGWLFRVARHALCRHFRKPVETVNLEDVPDRLAATEFAPAGTPAFEFLHWMAFLDTREREVMKMRFVEHWEYHEIAASQSIPIGTVQWRVFNAKKKLAPHLAARDCVGRNERMTCRLSSAR
jgi:RNA polymerase sigma-70 factor (ECF subfamily)